MNDVQLAEKEKVARVAKRIEKILAEEGMAFHIKMDDPIIGLVSIPKGAVEVKKDDLSS